MFEKRTECVYCGKKTMVRYDKSRHILDGISYKDQEEIEDAEAKGQKIGILVCNSCGKAVVCFFENNSNKIIRIMFT